VNSPPGRRLSTNGRLAAIRNFAREGVAVFPRPKPQAAPAPSEPPATPQPIVSPQGGCDPGYQGACVPYAPPDLDCDDIGTTVRVIGSDPHRLDGDGDGYGCES
jgi:hypothetical protein